ncbi:MAG: xanthine dehydrogenase family protein molybdopterin-binding subunit, partial [Alphaproteobacteria bacterium]
YVGDPVALVIAETLNHARDAADLIDIKFEMLPSITDTAQTVEPDAPRVWDDYPDNIAGLFQKGDAAGTEDAIAGAAHVV